MRAPSSNSDLGDCSPAAPARLARAAEHVGHVQVGPTIASGVHVVAHGGTATLQARRQHLDQSSYDRFELHGAKCAGRAFRMDSCCPQHLVGVDVAHSCHHRLVQQRCLDRTAGTPRQACPECIRIEHVSERLGAHPGQQPLCPYLIGGQHHQGAELALVVEEQHTPALEPDHHPCGDVAPTGSPSVRPDQLSGHPQVRQHAQVPVEGEDQHLSPSGHRLDPVPHQWSGAHPLEDEALVPQHIDTLDRLAHQDRIELSADGLDLGQLGHGPYRPSPAEPGWHPHCRREIRVFRRRAARVRQRLCSAPREGRPVPVTRQPGETSGGCRRVCPCAEPGSPSRAW